MYLYKHHTLSYVVMPDVKLDANISSIFEDLKKGQIKDDTTSLDLLKAINKQIEDKYKRLKMIS